MARIIYGVCGEGMGHAIRSKPILDHLSKKHDVKIFASRGAYDYLSGCFKEVSRVPGAYIMYKDNRVQRTRTVLSFIRSIPDIVRQIKLLKGVIRTFRPDIIITDYEITTAYAGMIAGVPVISIDNQHITRESIRFPKRYLRGYIETKIVNRINIPKADWYLVTSFFSQKSAPKRVILSDPVLRDSIIGSKPDDKDHILVYQTTATNKRLVQLLKKIDRRFIVYGFRKDRKEGNITFSKFDEKKFIRHLSECRALITNGGFTLISEALHLGKPVLSIPVKEQFEQALNAFYLDAAGYGRFVQDPCKKDINSFIRALNKYKDNLRRYKRTDNSGILKKLDSIICSVSSGRKKP